MSCLQGFCRGSRRIGGLAQLIFFIACPFLSIPACAQSSWSVVGPDGGDARAFAAIPGEPKHLYLGTTNSWLYESTDQGISWHRLAKIDPTDGFVLESIVVDSANPATLYVGAWKDSDNGGLWISHDSGHTWAEASLFKGRPVHALAQAPSSPRVLYAGTLEGVFRSDDGGATWAEISPHGSREIHEIESLAIDPKNDEIVYAGTWHLPWKTTDGGKTWHNIKQGIIEDSDVFSIIVDPAHPKVIYLSACSGIYRSENGGLLFHKIQGIPSEARRTRSLMQDPENREVVYAGTTEGLYKTLNGGKTFRRMTGDDVVVNDVYVDPTDSNRVLLATDRGGVLASQDAGVTFAPSNRGISARKVAALLVDQRDPERLYAGVVNDKTYGGVFRSDDGGAHWEQIGEGLGGRDVFSLAQTKDGAIVAGTGHGIFILNPSDSDDPPPAAKAEKAVPASELPAETPHNAVIWQPRNTIANTVLKESTETHYGMRVNIEKQVNAAVIELQSPVNALDVSGEVWVAATGYGVLTSHDQGASWQGGPVMGVGDYLSVAAHDETFVAARNESVVISHDSGQSWWPLGVPTMLTHIHRVVFSPDGTLWLGAREGIYYTRDLGKTWMWIQRLPFRDVDDMSYDPNLRMLLASSRTSDQVYAIDPKTLAWSWWPTGYQIELIRAAGNRLVAASLDDGVLVGPMTIPARSDSSAGVTAKQ
jgi:photosystem II stability/assembly factor-like uncharacterized protein